MYLGISLTPGIITAEIMNVVSPSQLSHTGDKCGLTPTLVTQSKPIKVDT